jgi:hypothetical protein
MKVKAAAIRIPNMGQRASRQSNFFQYALGDVQVVIFEIVIQEKEPWPTYARVEIDGLYARIPEATLFVRYSFTWRIGSIDRCAVLPPENTTAAIGR